MTELRDVVEGSRILSKGGESLYVAHVSYRSKSMVVTHTREAREIEIIREGDDILVFWPNQEEEWHVHQVDKPRNGEFERYKPLEDVGIE